MSLKIVPLMINRIVDSNNKTIYDYPSNTLLDKINIDLWNIILKDYMNCWPIAMGKISETYPGFRLITNLDCENKYFIESFDKFIRTYGGLYLFEKNKSYKNRQLFVHNSVWLRPLLINGSPCSLHDDMGNDIVQLISSNWSAKPPFVITHINSLDYHHPCNEKSHYLGLFVPIEFNHHKN